MSGFSAFINNNNPIVNSFYDIASINLPNTQTYTVNQYNVLASPTIDGSAGYVLQTNNNIISIADGSNGFYINNTGIYKISLCFSFDDSNVDSGIITTDFMLNAIPPITSTDIVGTKTILNVNATGTPLSFYGLSNDLPLSNEEISDNMIKTGTNSYNISNTFGFYLIPNIMYYSNTSTTSEDPFFFARYYLSTVNDSGVIPQVLCFESTVNITSTSDQSNYFYPCICPYNYTFWNTGNNSLPQPYMMVQMISSIPIV
jgi:hypothetical protein